MPAAAGSPATVTLTNSTVSGNSTAGDHSAGGGNLRLRNLIDTTVDGNRTTGEYAGGGGIAARERLHSADQQHDQWQQHHGRAFGGGGIFVTRTWLHSIDGQQGQKKMHICEYADGGGILATSTRSVALTDTTVIGNSTTGAKLPVAEYRPADMRAT